MDATNAIIYKEQAIDVDNTLTLIKPSAFLLHYYLDMRFGLLFIIIGNKTKTQLITVKVLSRGQPVPNNHDNNRMTLLSYYSYGFIGLQYFLVKKEITPLS